MQIQSNRLAARLSERRQRVAVVFAPDLTADYLVHLRRRNVAPSTIQAFYYRFATVERRMGVKMLDATRAQLEACMATIADEVKPGTVGNYQSCLAGFYKWARKQGLRPDDPAEHFEKPKQEQRLPVHLNVAQVERLLGALTGETPRAIRDAAVVALLYYTGMRAGELVGLTLERVNLAEGYLVVFGKGRKERELPIAAPLVPYLERWLSVRPSAPTGPLFIQLRAPYAGLRYNGVKYTMRAKAQAAGLPAKITPHKLRHTFATRLLRQGVALEQIQILLGHSNVNTTQIYAHSELNAGTRTAVDLL